MTVMHSIRLAGLLAAAGAALAAQTLVADRRVPVPADAVWIAAVNEKDQFFGDDFPLGREGETWLVERVRVWVRTPGAALGAALPKFELYAGIVDRSAAAGKENEQCACHALFPLKTIEPLRGRYSPAEVTRAGMVDGQTVWQVDFSGLRWSVPGGGEVQFAVRAPGAELQAQAVQAAHSLRVFANGGVLEKIVPDARRIDVQAWAQRVKSSQ